MVAQKVSDSFCSVYSLLVNSIIKLEDTIVNYTSQQFSFLNVSISTKLYHFMPLLAISVVSGKLWSF